MHSSKSPAHRSLKWSLALFLPTLLASSLLWAGESRAARPTVKAQSSKPARSNLAAAPLAAAETVPRPEAASGSDAAAPDIPAQLAPAITLLLSKATLMRLPQPIERISVGNPAIADVTPISPKEIYLLGKDLGTTNVILWSRGGGATIVDIKVAADPALLEAELREMLPGEPDIHVKAAAESIALIGTVSDGPVAQQAVEIAQAWIKRLTRGLVAPITTGEGKGGTTVSIGQTSNPVATSKVAGPTVLNMLRVRDPQQVMLEVKVAEVSKTLLDKLGVSIAKRNAVGDATVSLFSSPDFFNTLIGAARIATSGSNFIQLDAQRDDGLVKLLAEPNLMAISGQEASFNAGGKIFIPVARSSDTGGTTITLEEKEFGVGVNFKPTVLDGGRINLKVASRVSEPVSSGNPFTSVNGITAVLPSFTERRAETTVQLNDGQSFMIAGLIKGSSAQSIKRFPGLGEIPVIGTLFRSNEFQRDRSELMFVITPRLVKPLPPGYLLPTDNAIEPTRKDYLLDGKTEGTPPARSTAPAGAQSQAGSKAGGFEVK